MTSLIGFNPSISIHRHQDIWSLCVLDFYRYAGANLIDRHAWQSQDDRLVSDGGAELSITRPCAGSGGVQYLVRGETGNDWSVQVRRN